MTPAEMIHAEDLPGSVTRTTGALPGSVNGDLPGMLEALEKKIVMETLAEFSGNQSSAARHLGLTESGLRYKLNKWKSEGHDR